MLIDLSCPIELWGYELLHDDVGVTHARIDLFNVSDNTICAYAGVVRWSRDETGEALSDSIRVDWVELEEGTEFKLSLSTNKLRYADRVEIYFTDVEFTDAPAWKPDDSDMVDVGEQKQLTGEELMRLKEAAGDDALMYPQTQDVFWRCVCGRINPLSLDKCMRCRRERDYVLGELNRRAVGLSPEQVWARQKRQVRAKAASRQAIRAKQNTSLYTCLLLAACAAFIVLVMCMAWSS